MFGILVFGDSISFGNGEYPHIGWAGRLKSYFEDTFNNLFNLAIPGETTTGLLERMETELAARARYLRPEDRFVVLLAIGINDSKGLGSHENLQTDPETFQKNVPELIRIAKRHTDEVHVLGLTPVDEKVLNPFEGTYFSNERIKRYDLILKENAREHGVGYLHLFDHLSGEDLSELLQDGIHPNSDGYEMLYGIVSSYLREKGVLDGDAS